MTPDRSPPGRYVIVSPVKNEERYVELTLQSVAGQSIRPERWIIVDDGSVDGTAAMLSNFASRHSWIEVVRRPSGRERRPGAAVIDAFNAGLERIRDVPHEYVVKLDCDVELPRDYFERLLAKFVEFPRLGIASGVYLEAHSTGWQVVPMPPYHAAGASKVLDRACFQEIGGFVCDRGWDTVDEIRAQVRGWQTRHFDDIHFRHLKPEGSGIGSWRTNLMHGEVYYLTGGGSAFLVLKVVHRMVTAEPRILGGLALFWGYARFWLARRSRLVSKEESRRYRRLLNQRIIQRLRIVDKPSTVANQRT